MTRFVRQMVSEKVDLVATDEGAGYQKLDQAFPHETVDHKALASTCAAKCIPTTSNRSGRCLKRGVIGTYHNVSKKYLPLYLTEFQFRHNNRKNPDIFGEAIAGAELKRADWRALQWTGSDASETIQLELPFPSPRLGFGLRLSLFLFSALRQTSPLGAIMRMRLLVIIACKASNRSE